MLSLVGADVTYLADEPFEFQLVFGSRPVPHPWSIQYSAVTASRPEALHFSLACFL